MNQPLLPKKLGLRGAAQDDFFASVQAEPTPVQKIAPSVLLEVFQAPIVFHRIFVDITGSVTAALLLSQAIAIAEKEQRPGQWFCRSQEEWTAETGLSRFEQQTARRVLRDLGLMREERQGVPARILFQVNADEVWARVNEQARTNWAGQLEDPIP